MTHPYFIEWLRVQVISNPLSRDGSTQRIGSHWLHEEDARKSCKANRIGYRETTTSPRSHIKVFIQLAFLLLHCIKCSKYQTVSFCAFVGQRDALKSSWRF